MKQLGQLSAEDVLKGALVTQRKSKYKGFERAQTYLDSAALQSKLAAETIDVTLAGRGQQSGGLHPVTRTLERIEHFLPKLVMASLKAQVEDDYHNFEA